MFNHPVPYHCATPTSVLSLTLIQPLLLPIKKPLKFISKIPPTIIILTASGILLMPYTLTLMRLTLFHDG